MISSALNLLLTLECVLTLVKIQGAAFRPAAWGLETLTGPPSLVNFLPKKIGVAMRLSPNFKNIIP